MEVRVRERLIGALVLVAVVVLLVPALLKGPAPERDAAPEPATRSVEVTLDAAADTASDDALVPEPAVPPARTAPAPAEPGATAAGGRAEDPGPSPVPGREPSSRTAQAPAALPARSPAEAAAETRAWAVQLGAFATREKAESLVAQLRGRGYAAFVLEYRAGGQLLHRVRVGPEQERARAVAIAERLRKDGFQPVVAPHP